MASSAGASRRRTVFAPLQRCAGLPDALGALDRDGRQVGNELVKLVVDDTPLIRAKGAHRVESTSTSH
jgi:hypothetical protein